MHLVSGDYFGVLGVPVERRAFDAHDRATRRTSR